LVIFGLRCSYASAQQPWNCTDFGPGQGVNSTQTLCNLAYVSRKCRFSSFRCLQHSVWVFWYADFIDDECEGSSRKRVSTSTLCTASYCRLYGAYFAVIIMSTSMTFVNCGYSLHATF